MTTNRITHLLDESNPPAENEPAIQSDSFVYLPLTQAGMGNQWLYQTALAQAQEAQRQTAQERGYRLIWN